jgi:hypothetical protein
MVLDNMMTSTNVELGWLSEEVSRNEFSQKKIGWLNGDNAADLGLKIVQAKIPRKKTVNKNERGTM